MSLSPEERAHEVCRLFGIYPAGPDEGDWPHKLHARMAKAIRQAEDEALERAAEAITVSSFAERFMVAEWLRSLASRSEPEGGR